MTPRPVHDWRCRGRTLRLGERARVMGVLNVTPDSFSDGGAFVDPDAALARAEEMIAEGADLIDIGGESTRPGAEPVSLEEELARTVPVIEKIRAVSDVPISIDTTKAEVAERALEAGADILNDVSAFEGDPRMVAVAAESGAGVILMHMKGAPRVMQNDPTYGDVVAEVAAYLKTRVDFAVANGVERAAIMIDPGIGFGKTDAHNLELLRGLPTLARIAPVLIGASRKSLIGRLLDRADPAERVAGGLGIAAWATLRGAAVLRVHDVIDTCDVCRIVDTLRAGER